MRWRPAIIHPSDGTWCWVMDEDETEMWIAMADHQATGGWSYSDRWEDVERKVKWFWIIELPDHLPTRIT